MIFISKFFDELTARELYEIVRARQEIFLMEQNIVCRDFDGVDYLPEGIIGYESMENVIKMLPYSLEIREKIAYKNFRRVILSQNC